MLALLCLKVPAQSSDSLMSILNRLPLNRIECYEDTLECGILYTLAKRNAVPEKLETYVKRLNLKTRLKIAMLPPKHPVIPVLKKYLAFTYNHFGIERRDKGNVIAALDYLHKALKIYEELHAKSWIGVCYNNIANTYNDIGELDKAIDYMEKSLTILSKCGDKEEVAVTTVNLGYFLYLKKEYNKALTYYLNGLKIATDNTDESTLALANDRLGQYYATMGRYHEAMNNYQQSLKIAQKLDNKKAMAMTLNNMGECYSKQKNYQKALSFSQKALTLSQQIGNTIRIRNAAQSLAEIYQKLGNTKQAFDMYTLYIQMRDSTNNEMTYKRSLKKQMEFDFEKKEIILKQEQSRLQKLYEQKQKFYYILGAVLVLLAIIVAFFFYFWYKYKKEEESNNLHIELKEQLKQEIMEKESVANSIIDIQEKERENLAAELHDGVNQLLFAARMQLLASKSTSETTHKEGVKLIEMAIQEIKSIASNQGSFLLKNKTLKVALSDLIHQLAGNREIEIVFLDHGLNESRLNENQKINILRIIQELLNNSIKHSGATSCFISIKTNAHKVLFAVSDNGKGLQHKPNINGNGLKNISNKVKLMRGLQRNFSLHQRGNKMYIEIPFV